ncbi:hypothetical protein AB0I84_36960 [Streptomyces spectabilis]|uniref:hypothetical protein n=1 Tax=Streptomyces spectabilis TaxID=68270 RepID=UPI0033D8F1DA
MIGWGGQEFTVPDPLQQHSTEAQRVGAQRWFQLPRTERLADPPPLLREVEGTQPQGRVLLRQASTRSTPRTTTRPWSS